MCKQNSILLANCLKTVSGEGGFWVTPGSSAWRKSRATPVPEPGRRGVAPRRKPAGQEPGFRSVRRVPPARFSRGQAGPGGPAQAGADGAGRLRWKGGLGVSRPAENRRVASAAPRRFRGLASRRETRTSATSEAGRRGASRDFGQPAGPGAVRVCFAWVRPHARLAVKRMKTTCGRLVRPR